MAAAAVEGVLGILKAAVGEEKSELRDLRTDRGVAVVVVVDKEVEEEDGCFLSASPEAGEGAEERLNKDGTEEEEEAEAAGVSGVAGVERLRCWILGFLGVGPSRWFSEMGCACETTRLFSFPSMIFKMWWW